MDISVNDRALGGGINQKTPGAFSRVARYTLKRGGSLSAALILGVFLAVIVTNMGGFIDNIYLDRIIGILFAYSQDMMNRGVPLAITVYFIYTKTIWVILGVAVAFSIFGKEVKNYRSVFLQMKDEGYIEDAQSYGTGNWRIISRYLVPRIMLLVIPRLVVLVPGYVFLEATFAFLGAPDEYLPTLGKVIFEAFSWDALKYHLHGVLIPLAVLIILGTSFAMLGLALDRILNPRLREV